MLRAGAGVSIAADARAAAEEAADAALRAASAARFDAALLFATPHHAPALPALLDTVTRALGTEAVVGATAYGVVGCGQEHEGMPALALLGVSGIETCAVFLEDLRGESGVVGEEIAARLGGRPRESDLVVVLPDPNALEPAPLIQGLAAELGPGRVVGAGAFDAGAVPALQWSGGRQATGALSALVLRASGPPRIGVTQACRPVTRLLTVTRGEGSWVQELDGRPALDVFRGVARQPLAEDLRRAAAFVFAAVPVDGAGSLRPGTYLVRNVVGFAPEEGAIAVAHPIRRGERLALALREPSGARADLKEMLADLGPARPALAAYFNCCARGEALFGMSGLEAAYLTDALGDVPLAGMFGACEIGPIGTGRGARTELLTYTGVLALLDG